MNNDLLYQLALTAIPHIGPVQAKILLNHYNVKEIFHAKKSWLEKIEGIGPVRAASIVSSRDFSYAEKEIKFIEKYQIKPLFLTDPNYPRRLLNCYDSPTLLFYKGEADLNAEKIISIIGTRSNTDYGKQVTDKLIKDLAEIKPLVLSGLAFGIDAIAHKAAIRNAVPTVAVLAHGLDQIYPREHTNLAREMIKQQGGLLTEFKSGTSPDKHNFPSRNRVVAGMSDAVIVIETGIKGGSVITADLANGFNKDVFAIPGRVTDPKSSGANELIRTNKAALITDAKQFLELMQWGDNAQSTRKRKLQKDLFIELNEDEKVITAILEQKQVVHIDEIHMNCQLSNSKVASIILGLELNGIVSSLPGKCYKLT